MLYIDYRFFLKALNYTQVLLGSRDEFRFTRPQKKIRKDPDHFRKVNLLFEESLSLKKEGKLQKAIQKAALADYEYQAAQSIDDSIDEQLGIIARGRSFLEKSFVSLEYGDEWEASLQQKLAQYYLRLAKAASLQSQKESEIYLRGFGDFEPENIQEKAELTAKYFVVKINQEKAIKALEKSLAFSPQEREKAIAYDHLAAYYDEFAALTFSQVQAYELSQKKNLEVNPNERQQLQEQWGITPKVLQDFE